MRYIRSLYILFSWDVCYTDMMLFFLFFCFFLRVSFNFFLGGFRCYRYTRTLAGYFYFLK